MLTDENLLMSRSSRINGSMLSKRRRPLILLLQNEFPRPSLWPDNVGRRVRCVILEKSGKTGKR